MRHEDAGPAKTDLLPCPFCGAPGYMEMDDKDIGEVVLWRVICGKPGEVSCGMFAWGQGTQQEAAAEWNKRCAPIGSKPAGSNSDLDTFRTMLERAGHGYMTTPDDGGLIITVPGQKSAAAAWFDADGKLLGMDTEP